jgi:hypothetical protein
MHPTLELIKNELVQIAANVKSIVPSNEPFNVAHVNWSFPGITRDELAQIATSLVELIEQRGSDELKTNETLLADYVRRLSFLRSNTIQQLWGGNALGAVSAYVITLSSLRNVLEAAIETDNVKIEDERIGAVKRLKHILKSLRAIEVRISDVDSRSTQLNEMVARIEDAHEAADQLPTDLESLKELRTSLEGLLIDANADRNAISAKVSDINKIREQLDKSNIEATAILERCDAAYRATTSEGLASAFSVRSKKLNASMWIWVGGLVTALLLGAIIGSHQLHNLSETINAQSSQAAQNTGTIWIDLLLSLLSVGAPVWFAWISTKQIGQRFRLAEDYGYKASISTAYEGYRREAALLDPAFQARLFASALARLDEIPLRLVETDTHGSPWHELASSDLVRQAIDTVPGFVDRVTGLAKQAIPSASQDKIPSKSEQVKDTIQEP